MEYSLTAKDHGAPWGFIVLILILMEYSLTYDTGHYFRSVNVLILILMEYSLTPLDWQTGNRMSFCLNPYSNGILTDTSI